VVVLLMKKISAERYVNDIHLRIGLDWDQAIKKSQPSKLGLAACSAVELDLR
jgi:hypothetical protein